MSNNDIVVKAPLSISRISVKLTAIKTFKRCCPRFSTCQIKRTFETLFAGRFVISMLAVNADIAIKFITSGTRLFLLPNLTVIVSRHIA